MKEPGAFSFTRRLICAIIIDLAVLAVFLLTFAYFHHVRVRDVTPVPVATAPQTPVAQAAPASSEPVSNSPVSNSEDASTPEPVDESPAEPAAAGQDTAGMFGQQFADKFASGETEITDTLYKSKDISVEITKKEFNTSTYFVADIYVRDVSSFRTGVAMEYKDSNENKRKNVMQVPRFAELTGAVVAISGDNYVYRNAGVLAIRNGLEWAKKSPYTDDVCVMFYDGSMEVFSSKSAAAWREYVDSVYARGPYQVWSFGPSLLDENGQAKATFNNSVSPENPRSAIGYYEPGHYCFVLVDGRQAGYSLGLTLSELSQVFADLGCKLAYNLDGGDTVAMVFNGKLVNHPEGTEPRPVSDIVLIGEPVALNPAKEG